jgi:hypothetical protein
MRPKQSQVQRLTLLILANHQAEFRSIAVPGRPKSSWDAHLNEKRRAWRCRLVVPPWSGKHKWDHVPGWSGDTVRPYLKNNQYKKGWMCASSAECWPNKHKALSSNPSTAKKKKKPSGAPSVLGHTLCHIPWSKATERPLKTHFLPQAGWQAFETWSHCFPHLPGKSITTTISFSSEPCSNF